MQAGGFAVHRSTPGRSRPCCPPPASCQSIPVLPADASGASDEQNTRWRRLIPLRINFAGSALTSSTYGVSSDGRTRGYSRTLGGGSPVENLCEGGADRGFHLVHRHR